MCDPLLDCYVLPVLLKSLRAVLHLPAVFAQSCSVEYRRGRENELQTWLNGEVIATET